MKLSEEQRAGLVAKVEYNHCTVEDALKSAEDMLKVGLTVVTFNFIFR